MCLLISALLYHGQLFSHQEYGTSLWVGLGGEGEDGGDAKGLEGSSHLVGILLSFQLLLKAPLMVISMQAPVTVLIDGAGDARGRHQVL